MLRPRCTPWRIARGYFRLTTANRARFRRCMSRGHLMCPAAGGLLIRHSTWGRPHLARLRPHPRPHHISCHTRRPRLAISATLSLPGRWMG